MKHPAPRRIAMAAALLGGALLLCDAGYIHAKAWLAQALLDRAWSAVEQGQTGARPWPWADTAPVARLSVTRLGIEQIVLSGDSGRNLAFGPAWNEASAAPGTAGTSVISGHRDTHFGFLRLLRNGDEIRIERHGSSQRYSVASTRIVDASTTHLAPLDDNDSLLLVTCYPFDALSAGGPLRYVVEAQRIVQASY